MEEMIINKEFPNYAATKSGIVYSLNYNKTGDVREMKGYLLISGNNEMYRRLRLSVYKDGKEKCVLKSRFVYCTIKGLPITTRWVIRHKDDDPLNNHIDNLCRGTHLDNMRDKVKRDRQYRPPSGEGHQMAKLTNNQAKEIRGIYLSTKISQRKLAKKYGVDQASINRIVNNKAYNDKSSETI